MTRDQYLAALDALLAGLMSDTTLDPMHACRLETVLRGRALLGPAGADARVIDAMHQVTAAVDRLREALLWSSRR